MEASEATLDSTMSTGDGGNERKDVDVEEIDGRVSRVTVIASL